MKSNYIMILATKTHCPSCDENPMLVQHFHAYSRKPQFYICFTCRRVFEVGRGEVERLTDNPEIAERVTR